MKIASIVGARPQFIKAATVSRVVRTTPGVREIFVHTGQHYDENMSDIFFEELEIPRPDYHLGIGSGSHGAQTGRMLEAVEQVLLKEQPDWVLVYGDTNSTLAAALAAAKLHIPVAHVEAGLRSYNRRMPEEINRVVADHVSAMLFCPSERAVANLAGEGFKNIANEGRLINEDYSLDGLQASPENPLVINVGDVMYDVLLYNIRIAEKKSGVLERLDLDPKSYYLATIHRAENTGGPARLRDILEALAGLDRQVVLPLHPRTREAAASQGMDGLLRTGNLRTTDPVSYLDMLVLEKHAAAILTDSGGVQKEAYWLGVPCVTLREETEWLETVEAGANILVGTDRENIAAALNQASHQSLQPDSFYGDGHTTVRILRGLLWACL